MESMTIWRKSRSTSQTVPPVSSKSKPFDVLSTNPFNFGDDFVDVKDDTLFARSFDQAEERHQVKSGESISGRSSISRRLRLRRLRTTALYVSLALFMSFTGFALAKYRPWLAWFSPELVYAYFEVRAVDQTGRPVAGAVVKNAGKKVGTTDSFGEWRRFMRVPLGTTVPITLMKSVGKSDVLYATKNFAVPPAKPERSDVEIRASIQLLAAGALEVKAVADQSSEKSISDQNQRINEPSTYRVKLDKNNDSATLPSPTLALTSAGTAASASRVFASTHESIYFEAIGSKNSLLAKEIVPALEQRVKELGVKVDPNAAWKVRLTGLLDRPAQIGPDGGGLVLVSSFDQSSQAPVEFLRNYQSDARVTARGILYILTRQVQKNVAVFQTPDQRWIAALPASSSTLWNIAPSMSFSGHGRILSASSEVYKDTSWRGVILKASPSEQSPCSTGDSTCQIYLRSYAEVPPVPGWVRLKLRTSTKFKDLTKIFVSGYEARQIESDLFEYWGQDKAKANLSAVSAGRVLHRAQVQNSQARPPLVVIGSSTISRR
jgi:hypothetical protein